MGTEKDKIRNTFADQLERFDDMLQPEANDVDMLAEIQKGIGSLLASGVSSEAEIRLILQQRYDSGRLRKETFQQIKTILDRYAIERSPAAPKAMMLSDRPLSFQPIYCPWPTRQIHEFRQGRYCVIGSFCKKRFPAAVWASYTKRSIDDLPRQARSKRALQSRCCRRSLRKTGMR